MKTINYEIVYYEDNNIKFKQFKYEIEDNVISYSYLPTELYEFYKGLQDKNVPTIVFVGEQEKGTGLLRYCGAHPVN